MNNSPMLIRELGGWWQRQRDEAGVLQTCWRLMRLMWEFLLETLPSRRRQRYGDIDYDWERRVDTTSATVSHRARFLGLLNSPYQPIPPEQFREMMSALEIDFREFTFIDIGSGKGRALLLAAEYGFRQIIGIELIPELHRVSQRNVEKLRNTGTDAPITLICGDAADLVLPKGPIVLFLFNPLPREALRRLIERIDFSLNAAPRPLLVAYANPVFETVLSASSQMERIAATSEFLVFRNRRT